jgi:hypothetical protein
VSRSAGIETRGGTRARATEELVSLGSKPSGPHTYTVWSKRSGDHRDVTTYALSVPGGEGRWEVPKGMHDYAVWLISQGYGPDKPVPETV